MSTSAAYSIVGYTIENLEMVLAQIVGIQPTVVNAKLHRTYFEGYLSTLGARSMVIEHDYVDRDYLVDYATYYVRCFHPYARHCARIHFFKSEVSEPSFQAWLEGGPSDIDDEVLQRGYLGFMVVKPLPQTFIGRTCLVPYDSDGGRRCYPVTRTYEVYLFGARLRVESLAFQEQDKTVAACATSALWSALHATALRFQHQLPTPSELTGLATNLEPLVTRQFPSSGLSAAHMARGIRAVGLEPYLVNAGSAEILTHTSYAYLRCGIPAVLGLELIDRSDENRKMGLHAITLTGYSLGKPEAVSASENGLMLTASRVDKLYAHDDQVGPFSRLGVLEGNPTQLSGSWRGRDRRLGSIFGQAKYLLVPVYHKVRIPYATVENTISYFDEMLHSLRTHAGLKERLVWDIYLMQSSAFKEELRRTDLFSGSRRREILSKSLPRFLWRATAMEGASPVLDIVFDATDLDQGHMLAECEIYDGTLAKILRVVAESPLAPRVFRDRWAQALASRLSTPT